MRIKDNVQLETVEEVSLRELFEEISIRKRTSRKAKTITIDNYQKLIYLKVIGYLQYHVDDKRGSNDRYRLIGLFICHIDERKLRFQLKDKKENQVNQYDHRYSYIYILCFQKCAWLNIETILSTEVQLGYDPYYTLRPFAQ